LPFSHPLSISLQNTTATTALISVATSEGARIAAGFPHSYEAAPVSATEVNEHFLKVSFSDRLLCDFCPSDQSFAYNFL